MSEQTDQQADGPKVWEQPWGHDALLKNSTSWSLAGDAGLLLGLKQFSENLLSKSVNLEKELDKLLFEERQSHVKLNNVTTSFLLLENTQFIENRVYEEDIANIQSQDASQTAKPEKTKEEKDQELLAHMNEAVNVGMSIMDTYFEKLDARKLRDEYDDEDEAADAEEDNLDKKAGNLTDEDLLVYEAKDPYVLRSLPYLIGSDAYLENDHVGLKDLESDEEVEEEEEEAADDEPDKKDESSDTDESVDASRRPKTTTTKKEMFDDDSDDYSDESEQDRRKPASAKKQQVASDSEDGDDDGDLFKTAKISRKDNLFDDDDEDEDEDPMTKLEKEISSKKAKAAKKSAFSDSESEAKDEEEPEEQQEEEPAPKAPKQMDFAAELAARLSGKAPPKAEKPKPKAVEEPKAEEAPKPKPVIKPATNLFDSGDNDDDEDANDLFQTKTPAAKPGPAPAKPASKVKSLFDDSNSEEDEEASLFAVKPATPAKPTPTKPATTTISESGPLGNDDDDEEEKAPEPKVVKSDKQAKLTSELNNLFGGGPKAAKKEEEAKKPPAKPVASIFDDDDDDDADSGLFGTKAASSSTLSPPAPVVVNKPAPAPASIPSKPKISLFDDEEDEEDEGKAGLFSPQPKKPVVPAQPKAPETPVAKSEPAVAATPSKTTSAKASTLFDDDDDDDDDGDLFKKAPSKPVLPPAKPTPASITTQPPVPAKPTPEPPKPAKIDTKKSLFDSESTDESEDDIFSKPPAKKVAEKEKPAVKEENVFDSITSDPEPVKAPEPPPKPALVEKKAEPTPASKPPAGPAKNTKSLFGSEDSDEDDDGIFKSAAGPSKLAVIKDQKQPEAPKSTIKSPLEEPMPVEEEPAKAPQTLSEKKLDIANKFGARMAFNPLDLKSSGLFKKVKEQAKGESSEEDEPPAEPSKPEAQVKPAAAPSPVHPLDPPAPAVASKPPAPAPVAEEKQKPVEEEREKVAEEKPKAKSAFKSSLESALLAGKPSGKPKVSAAAAVPEDIFADVSTPEYSNPTFNSAQKDRIKASGRRRAAPTLKKPAQEEDDIFGLKSEPVIVRKPSVGKVPEKPEPAVVKPVEPEPKEEKAKVVSPKTETTKPKTTIPPLASGTVPPPDLDLDLDLEPDLFATKPKTTPAKDTKPAPPLSSVGSFMPPPDDGDDDELFNLGPSPALVGKDKAAKKPDILFPANIPDEDDIFSDVSILNLKKKEPAKPKASESPAKKTTPSKPTANLFSPLSDDDDIFNMNVDVKPKASSSKPAGDSKKSDDIFDDPLNVFGK